jgi:hypothetical protein
MLLMRMTMHSTHYYLALVVVVIVFVVAVLLVYLVVDDCVLDMFALVDNVDVYSFGLDYNE